LNFWHDFEPELKKKNIGCLRLYCKPYYGFDRNIRKIRSQNMGQLIVSKKGAVGTIVFSSPAKMNAMTYDMWMGVPKALKEFEADPEVRVIVLKGDGEKAFISGADISQFEELRATPKGQQDYEDSVSMAMKYPTVCSKPVIAQIRGYCFGGGLGLAAACDIRICSEDATFRMPAARLGLGYGAEGIKQFMNLLGLANTTDIFFTARRWNAADALRMGFVSKVVPVADLQAAVDEYTTMIAENAPMTVRAAKYAMRQNVTNPDKADMAGAQKMVDACFASDDFKEGRKAFMEKRIPNFQGR